ncbi:Mfa1 family fimbria major subunit [Porphyromonas levii]|uniref:Mfa1 family fimbria major subunit n=1 Tax=Porphyromonas levii TaxID=28114 RepID=UPI002012D1B3|nr:Mfa1 family fimbria major subunit [Porphyromonas levii]MBR8759719.1 Minor fimbrium subunit Mfa1 [Porphyromonas levii]
MKRFLSIGAISLALIMGFTSCKDKGNGIDAPDNTSADTYVGLSIAFPAPTTRVLPKDYNDIGEWTGRDLIKTITVYVVTDNATINSTTFTETAFNSISQDGVLKPNLAVEAKSGQSVKAYVVINDVQNKVITELNQLGAAEFDAKFATTVAKVTAVSDVASYDGTNDIVVMTNDETPKATTIAAGISQDKAKTGPTNLLKVNASRVAARGILTVETADETNRKIVIKRTHTTIDNTTGTPETKTTEETTATVTISDIQYQVTGSALQFNVLKDATKWEVPSDVYNFTPATDWATTETNAANILTFKDEYKAPIAITGNTLKNVNKALGDEKFSKFVLPVTHAKGNYKKGNTTMFEVKATFTVDKVDGVANSNVQTVYFGLSDGLFYSTKEKAQMMDKDFNGTVTSPKQEVKEYKNGEMYYYIWLNPDVDYSNVGELIKESPTVRNHIYNAHITGFKEMGVASKEEIKPGEDLETKKTYLSVEIKVLPWTIHSYTVDLGNRY